MVTSNKVHFIVKSKKNAQRNNKSLNGNLTNYYYLASAAVAVDSSHHHPLCGVSRFSPPSNFVNGHVSTMWLMVCCWSQSQEGDWARPQLSKLAWQGHWPVWKQFIRDHIWRRRLKPGCRIVGSVTIVWLTTETDDQSSLHCVLRSNAMLIMSDKFSPHHTHIMECGLFIARDVVS